jgi:hypothetical protein
MEDTDVVATSRINEQKRSSCLFSLIHIHVVRLRSFLQQTFEQYIVGSAAFADVILIPSLPLAS